MKQTSSQPRLDGKIPGRIKYTFALGALGKDMIYGMIATFSMIYFTDIIKVNPVFIGVMFFVAKLWDAFNDLFMGMIVDNTRSRWGKFIPWLVIGTLVNSIVFVVLFTDFHLDGVGLCVFATAAYILWGMTYTIMDIPYWSMIPAFTEGGKERENMSTMARSCAGVGSALVTIITMQCVYMLGKGNEYAGFKWFALIISILFFAAILITCLNIREKSTVDVETVSVKQMFKALFQNDQAVTVVITIVLINTSVYITSNLVIYFFKYDFGGADWYNGYTLFNTFGGAIQILSMMVLFPLLRKFLNTIKIFYVSFVMAIAGYIVLFILIFTSMSSVFILFIPAFFIFAANGMLLVLTTIFLANTVDYGEFKNKRRDESVIFSMQTFVVKLASGIAALVVSICLSVCRLSSNTDVVTDAVAGGSVVGLRMTMTVIPVIGLLIAVFYFHRKYILTEQKMEEISERIKESH